MPTSPPLHFYPSRVRSKKQIIADDRADTKRYNDSRDPSDTFYSQGRWKRVRKWHIAQQPLCVTCRANGITVIAKIVDHIVPIKRGGAPLDGSNLQSLCQACHNKKTASERTERVEA